MFTNNRRFVSEQYTRDEYINLGLSLCSPPSLWEHAIQIMSDRIEGRYLEPMRILLQSDPNKNGFAAMALGCLLIETLMQFRYGFPVTPSGHNLHYYAEFLCEQIGNDFTSECAKKFYRDIRCGILHSAQTKNGSCLTYNGYRAVYLQGNDILMVDVELINQQIGDCFESYCNELKNPENLGLRSNFIKKMNDITRSLEGSSVIDNIWFAICAMEGMEVPFMTRGGFCFQVLSPDTIKTNDNRYISKSDIEEAFYYWPDRTAINMRPNARYILPLFYNCHELLNDLSRATVG